jgi:hypothetical protein
MALFMANNRSCTIAQISDDLQTGQDDGATLCRRDGVTASSVNIEVVESQEFEEAPWFEGYRNGLVGTLM